VENKGDAERYAPRVAGRDKAWRLSQLRAPQNVAEKQSSVFPVRVIVHEHLLLCTGNMCCAGSWEPRNGNQPL